MTLELQIRFPGSNFASQGRFSEHSLAYQAMLDHYSKMKADIKALGNPVDLELQRVSSSTDELYQVIKTDNSRARPTSGQMMLYRIIERPDEKLSPEELEKLGVTGKAGQKTYKKGPRHNGGAEDKTWSEL